MRLASVLLALACLTGCQRDGERAAHVIANKPPERKDVIEAVLASHDVPLSVSPSCSNVGTEPDDQTIGEYLSGFLAALDSPEGKNWLETRVSEAQDSSGGAVWRCELTVRHSAGEDEWGWGVRFDIGQADGRVRPGSFLCTGGG